MPTPVKSLDNMSKHLTREERDLRSAGENALPSRPLKRPKLIRDDPAAAKHWARIVKSVEGLDLLDELDADALSIYCAKLARRDVLQAEYLRYQKTFDNGNSIATLKIMLQLSGALQEIERALLAYGSKLGLTPESRLRLARRAANPVEDSDADLFGEM